MRFLFLSSLFFILPLCAFAKTYTFVGAVFPEVLEQKADGSIYGPAADITRLIAKRLGIKIEIKIYPLKRALKLMEDGKADAIIGPYKSDLREKYLYYTDFHIYEDPLRIYVLPKTKVHWTGKLQDLKKYRIGLITGWSLGDAFDQIKKSLNLTYVNQQKQLFALLETDRVDIIITHPRAASNSLSLDAYKEKYKSLEPPVIYNYGYFGFSKIRSLSKLRNNFESEYHKLVKEGIIPEGAIKRPRAPSI